MMNDKARRGVAEAHCEVDDARSEESVVSDSSESDDESTEEEPLLKYRRIRMAHGKPEVNAHAHGSLLAEDPTTSIDVTTKVMCVGTADGCLHLMDLGGQIHRSIRPHKRAVTAVSIDAESQFVASGSDDGTVAISSIWSTGEPQLFSYHRPVKAVQIDPLFSTNGESSFASGGLAGQCLIHERGWFGSSSDKVLHEGEGPIRALAWAHSLLAWGNDWGIKIYDFHRKERISYVERPQADEGALGRCACHLCWENEHTLLIGWLRHVMIVSIVEGLQMQRKGAGGGRFAEITSLIRTEYEVTAVDFYSQYHVFC